MDSQISLVNLTIYTSSRRQTEGPNRNPLSSTIFLGSLNQRFTEP